ncbi:MAG: hypothetical protein ACI86M_000639 [Saprospiraceae bacterium]|jgi:hypothetical protein
MKNQDNRTKNIGQLKSSTHFLSKVFKGSLFKVRPYNPKSFFITAEDKGNVKYPSLIVLSTAEMSSLYEE